MIKHIILWKLKDDVDAPSAVAEAKARLEALNGRIDGLVSLTVRTDKLTSSNADMMLDSSFDSEAALAAYQINPLHVEAASFVRSVVSDRLCLDYEE